LLFQKLVAAEVPGESEALPQEGSDHPSKFKGPGPAQVCTQTKLCKCALKHLNMCIAAAASRSERCLAYESSMACA